MLKTIAVALTLLLATPALASVKDAIYGHPDYIAQAMMDPEVPAPPQRPRTHIVTADTGGSIIHYIQAFNDIRREGAFVRIEDVCLSACTLILGLVPPENVCVTEHTLMGFHSARDGVGNFHMMGTRLAWHIYPEWVRAKLLENGWNGDGPNGHPDFLYFPGTDFYPLCNARP